MPGRHLVLEPPAGAVRGACPTVAAPLEAADGLLVRVRVPGGVLPAAGVRALAAVAARDGSGVLELTSRANVQVRGVRTPALARLQADLSAAGLVSPVPVDVVVAPGAGLDRTEVADARPLAAALVRLLGTGTGTGVRHPKAGVLLDGGGAVGLRDRTFDVAIGAARLGPAGPLVAQLALAAPLDEAATGEHVAVVPLEGGPAVAAAVLDLAGDRRVRELVAEQGADTVLRQAAAHAAVAIEWVPETELVRADAVTDGGRAPLGDGGTYVGAAPVLGRLDAAQATRIAEAAVRHGDGLVRLTPWRSVIVGTSDPAGLRNGLAGAGLVTDPDDPATAVVACAGCTGCPAGLTDAQADARRIIAARQGLPPRSVHVSGCAKRCASRQDHDLTLVGSAPDRYDVYRRGRLESTGVTIGEVRP
jgi:precorrin-3B synthase